MKKGLLQQLEEGIVIGDGGYVWALEKRGYVTAGPWTPEAVIENPDAVRQLHREFLRAGSNVLQAFTFYSSDDKLKFGDRTLPKEINCNVLTDAGCKIAFEVANEGNTGALVAGTISTHPAYNEGKGKEYIQMEVKKQCDVFIKNKVDFIICEFFSTVEEIEWTIEEVKKTGIAVMSTVCVGKEGDSNNVPIGECGVRMAKAKADVVGVNCYFDPYMTLDAMEEIIKALEKENLKPFLATQPNGFMTTGTHKHGYLSVKEFPFAMESRTINRFDAHKYARRAYAMGVRYIGGCCGFEAYHIRAIAEELSVENKGRLPPASDKNMPWGKGLELSTYSFIRDRANRKYWENLVSDIGRKKI